MHLSSFSMELCHKSENQTQAEGSQCTREQFRAEAFGAAGPPSPKDQQKPKPDEKATAG